MSVDENKPQGNIEWLKTYNLALEDRVSCDTLNCPNDAKVYSRVKCCGAVIIGCEPCMHNTLRAIMGMIHQGEFATCKSCHKNLDPRGWLSRPEKI